MVSVLHFFCNLLLYSPKHGERESNLSVTYSQEDDDNCCRWCGRSCEGG